MEAKNLKKPTRSVLGRGLSALISTIPVPVAPHRMAHSDSASAQGDRAAAAPNFNPEMGSPLAVPHITEASAGNQVTYVEIGKIKNNPKQPRQEFDQSELSELAHSIKTLGVLQPVLLRRVKDGVNDTLEIVAGERRWRASQVAGLVEIPAIILDIDDRHALEIALVENVQRANLNPIEEAQAYERLATEFLLSQKDIAERVGKDRASVANYLRLLKLPTEIQELLRNGKFSMGHAKAIMTIAEPAAQLSLARKVIEEGLSVRALEAIAGRVVVLGGGKRGSKAASERGAKGSEASDLPHVVDKLREALGTKINIKHQPSGQGRIEIDYYSEQELDRIVDLLCK